MVAAIQKAAAADLTRTRLKSIQSVAGVAVLSWSRRAPLRERIASHLLRYNSCPASEKFMELPIDWTTVNWPYVIVLSLIVFVCTLVGSFVSFRHIFGGAVITALLFAKARAPPPPAASGKPDIR